MAKYVPFGKIPLKNRTWADKVIDKAPTWVSVDLRDGNQALAIPMTVAQKLEFFDVLVKTGFKEIEIGFPSASSTEFDFLRRLIDENRIPDDVTIQVLCQAREHLIKKTFEALQGVKKAIFHIYNSTSPAQRKYTFNMTKEEIVAVAIEGVQTVKKYMYMAGETEIILEYSPESFSNTEIEFAVEICEAVKKEWGATKEHKMILNLPTTVECAGPNVHADQIEYFCQHISDRDAVIISLHTHNDRGTGVASAELGMLAGAERVEGTLFGNGERTGNVDIITLALNMYTQGVDPKLDFSHIAELTETYSRLTSMQVHPRHPYCGELIFTAFSGSHQDAIRKGLAARKEAVIKAEQQYGKPLPFDKEPIWDVPYLPIDPHDLGREYEEIIRVNSQSGKGGAAWILEENYSIFAPKTMHPIIGAVITSHADKLQRELSTKEIYDVFVKQWLTREGKIRLVDLKETYFDDNGETVLCKATIEIDGKPYSVEAKGNGPLDAMVAALGHTQLHKFTITAFHEHAIGAGSGTDAIAYVQIKYDNGIVAWGCGKSSHIGHAGIHAVISALNQN